MQFRWRETTAPYKVWKSTDAKTWELVTPALVNEASGEFENGKQYYITVTGTRGIQLITPMMYTEGIKQVMVDLGTP